MTERNLAQEQADAYAETLADIWETIDGTRMVECEDCGGTGATEPASDAVDTDDCATCDGAGEIVVSDYEGSDPFEYLGQMPLEIVWELGEPFAVVLGTGGPHTEITGGGRASGSGYELWSYWGGERGVCRGAAINRTGDYFREMVES